MKKLLLIWLMIPTLAMAEFRSGNQLFQEMQSTGIVDQMVSLGYVMGVTDAMNGVNHCPPSNVTAGQLRDMVKNYLNENAHIRHFSADIVVLGVLRQTWPCKSQGKKL